MNHQLKFRVNSRVESGLKSSVEIRRVVESSIAKNIDLLTIYLVHIFVQVDREGEEERFKDIGNKMLLWHGSRMTNYGGILSQGLRIAPPEAPVSGYMVSHTLQSVIIQASAAFLTEIWR
jgi:hypothetical protein